MTLHPDARTPSFKWQRCAKYSPSLERPDRCVKAASVTGAPHEIKYETPKKALRHTGFLLFLIPPTGRELSRYIEDCTRREGCRLRATQHSANINGWIHRSGLTSGEFPF